MSNPSTSGPTHVRDINLLAVLEVLRADGSSTRAEISRRTGLSSPTISDVVADLVSAGVVEIAKPGPATGGRRGGLVELVSDAYVVAVIDLSARRPLVGRVDLLGRLVESSVSEIPREALRSPLDLATWFGETYRDDHVIGLGISVPGVTDPANGRIEWAPRFGWRDVEMRDLFRLHGGIDGAVVENDLNLAAVGEHAASGGRDSNMVMLGLRGGLGAGVIVGGSLYRGTHNSSGEVGYLATGRQPLGSSQEFGALEGEVFEELRQAGLIKASDAYQLDDQEPRARPSEAARNALDDLIFQAVVAIATVLDPETIVIGAELTELLPDLSSSVQPRLAKILPHAPWIVDSQLGGLASLRGAGTVTLDALGPSFRRLLS
ncbi:MAG: xylR [Aeromicrobium sp.]|jgi:predicted NBD/HSP70 family sugar kinase|nr:xylR [Aeromicrobium sp.]